MKVPCINAMRSSSYLSYIITGHLFSFNRKMHIALYFDTKPIRLFRAITANANLIRIRHIPDASCRQLSQTTEILILDIERFFSSLLHASEV